MKPNLKLTMAQVQADLFSASDAIKRAENMPSKESKYVKGMAGYHLQQAAEKMIKVQLYSSGMTLNNARIYRHSLDDLIIYAGSIGVSLSVPAYVRKYKSVISDWEAQGRYDVHFVVRIDQLKRAYKEISAWYEELIEKGYK